MKRMWVASAVASLLFTGLIALVGYGEAQESNGILLPGPGATATYEARPVGADPSTTIDRVVVSWGEPTVVIDDQYDKRAAWPVDVVLFDGDREVGRVWAYYDAETQEPLLDGQQTARAFSTGAITGTRTEVLAFDLYHELRGLCGLLDGPNLDLASDRVTLHGHCSRLDGEARTVMERTAAGAFRNPADERFQVHYEKGIPFPTVLTVPFSDMLLRVPHSGAVWELRLSEWTAPAMYGGSASLVEDGPGPVPLLPRTPHGLDDRGLEHPFPLSAAVAEALSDSADPRVVDFEASHDGVYLVAAWSNREVDGSGNHRYHWYLSWTDGAAYLGKHVISHPGGAAGVSHPDLPRTVEVQDYRASFADGPFPVPASVPVTLPDPAALFERYRMYEIAEEELHRYGYQHYCDGDCSASRSLVAVGRFTRDTDNAQSDPFGFAQRITTGFTSEYSQLTVDEAGQPLFIERATYNRDAAPPTGATAAESGGGWNSPPPEAVAGIGAAALFAGLLVYLAPLAKLPLLGLFSRVTGEKLLEHPARAAIHAAIEAEPGIHFQELSRRLEIGRSALDHHLRKLAQSRLILAKVSPGYTCYFPKRTSRDMMQAAPFLRAPGPRSILEAIVHESDRTVAALAARTGLSRSTVSHHLKRMEKAGLVIGGGRQGYHPTGRAVKVV